MTSRRAKKADPSSAVEIARAFRDEDYAALAQFRHELRKFLAFSESAARREGLTPQQHQALLAIKGFSQQSPLSVGDLAKYLLIQNHSAVELVDRMGRLGLLQRAPDPEDGRRILIRLSAEGERRLKRLSSAGPHAGASRFAIAPPWSGPPAFGRAVDSAVPKHDISGDLVQVVPGVHHECAARQSSRQRASGRRGRALADQRHPR
jgi:DNA-binding MarR family transcriptional regulator